MKVLVLVAGAVMVAAMVVGVAGTATLVPVAAVASPAGASTSEPATQGDATVAVDFAVSQLGVPYLWGGTGRGGWDCSGLVQAAYAAAGLRLPRVAAAQYAATAGTAVSLGALAPGDLVFFGASPATISHVGIAVDAHHMVDAPHTGAVVRIEDVHWADLLAATRPLPPTL